MIWTITMLRSVTAIGMLVLMGLVFVAGNGEPDQEDAHAALASERVGAQAALTPQPVAVPPLPFADNPDPEACGIPREWTGAEPAYVSGEYQGTLVQPVVYLYDSHLRREVVGQIPDGGRVQILLSQSNPVLDYYLVRSLDLDEPQQGWIPAPFLVIA